MLFKFPDKFDLMISSIFNRLYNLRFQLFQLIFRPLEIIYILSDIFPSYLQYALNIFNFEQNCLFIHRIFKIKGIELFNLLIFYDPWFNIIKWTTH